MTQGRRGGISLAIFIFLPLSYNYGTQINEHFTRFGHDCPSSSFFFALVGPIKHVIAMDLQTFSKRKTNAAFNHIRTVIPVAPECRDTTGSARLYRGTWLLRNLYKDKKRCMVVRKSGIKFLSCFAFPALGKITPLIY
jgi:hypothetical protein